MRIMPDDTNPRDSSTEVTLPGGVEAAESAVTESAQPPSLTRVMVHSFIVIPFLIALAGTGLYASVRILTAESKDVYELLSDIENGHTTKRWQAAFELSRILSRPESVPGEVRFISALARTFERARNDSNPQVRQYLALAMGRAGSAEYVEALLFALEEDSDANRPYILSALGLIGDPGALTAIAPYTTHSKARMRLQAVIALGNIGGEQVKPHLKHALHDPEINVQWDAAVALAKLGDGSGRDILLSLLRREYLSGFDEVDGEEENRILLAAIQAGAFLEDPGIDAATKLLAEQDPNMKVRQAALDVLRKENKPA